MNSYKHTQIGYLMIVVSCLVIALFGWTYAIALTEPVSYNSGSNFAVTLIMAFVLLIISSFATLTVAVDEKNLNIKFGYGLFKKNFLLAEIASAKSVKNHWYYGWGIRFCLRPKMVIYNVSGFDAVEIVLKNGKTYRIGTDDPSGLEAAIKGCIGQ
jgi:hypothetical protein